MPTPAAKRALITGITGQDGSYLAELLLAKGYEVHGLIRRSSSFNTERIDHLYQDPHTPGTRLKLHYGDLTDGSCLRDVLTKCRPTEVYNLGAQSHVRVSFDEPVHTVQVDALGTIMMLEAIRDLMEISGYPVRFYQASSSEMFGQVAETPQKETTPFHPRSPYGCAKVYSYWQVVNYRESYGMFACNGVLFNHETVTAGTPLMYKRADGRLDIKPIAEIVREEAGVEIDEGRRAYQGGSPRRALEVWDRNGWTRVTYASAYPHEPEKDPKRPRLINARQACYMGTSSHKAIMDDGSEKSFGDLAPGDRVALVRHPDAPGDGQGNVEVTKDQALLLGILTGDGWVSEDGRHTSVTNSSPAVRDFVRELWLRLGGSGCSFYPTTSGFEQGKVVGKLNLLGDRSWLLAFSLYNQERSPFGDRTKRVPWQILNAPPEIMREYLRGYNLCDGLKANRCIYEFRNFKTNSATLAAGLVYLVGKTTGQEPNITVEASDAWGRTALYYSINLLSDSPRGEKTRRAKPEAVRELLAQGLSQHEVARRTGISRTYVGYIARGYEPPVVHHLARPRNEIKKIIDLPDYDGWFYDLETQSGTFHCGVGFGHVHNSPRRGETFVTRKVTRAATRIKLGLQDKLFMGNLEAKRDWGFAGDYVEAMWRMLQHEKPDDYVVATGETHSVREWIEVCFGLLGLDWKKHVEVDPRYFRPAEVDLLLGDATKARTVLGWEPKVRFADLAKMMVEHDLKLAEREKVIHDHENARARG